MKHLWKLALASVLLVLAACTATQPRETPTYTAGSHPGYAPGRKGEVKTITIGGKPFTYEVIDGLAIYQGDMILGSEAQLMRMAARAAESGIKPQGVGCSEGFGGDFGWSCTRWPGGRIPYVFANDWGSEASNITMRTRILQAIAHWEEHTNLDFYEDAGGPNKLVFKNSQGCSSFVGRRDDLFNESQDVNLNMGCDLSAVIHEIGHAVGLYHEHSREDRDSFVQVLWGNIQDGRGHNFNRHVDDGFDIGPYDFESIMHYDCFAFSRNGMPTLQILTPGITCANVGDNVVLSEGDILSAYRMYPPSFSIGGLTEGQSFQRNGTLNPTLTAPDPIRPAFVQWFLDASATPFGSGTSPSLNLNSLTVGNHTLTARVIIKGVVVGERSIGFRATNVNPTVSILEPANGTTVCVNQNVTFRASVGDVDSPGFTLPNSAVSWRVGAGAPFATGKEVSRSFSPAGSYTVTVTASDADGGTASAPVNLTVVNCTNNPPTASITNPASDLDVTPSTSDANGFYYQITLQGNATDPEDGPLSGASLVWTTNRADVQPGGPSTGDQDLGTGTSVTNVRLYTTCAMPYFGTVVHRITLTATDSAGNRASRTRLITVRTLC
ncbi:M12 family metallopeptidase [Meiothermus cerbereus]|uniref:M12 family metallopeptidase n=1 Tax=Meiothermus cerbereus TaxID=65552 RepID=UPI003EEEE889